MVQTTDGFKIAQADVALRGPGDVLGTQQSGLPEFKLADIVRDEEFLIQTRKKAFELIKKDPYLKLEENAQLAAKIQSIPQLNEVKLN